MKKIRLFKIPFSFDELDAEFNFLNADNDYCGMLLKLLKKYTDFFNLGLAGIPYKERYEILNARTRKEKAIADTIYENNFYEVEGNDIFLADFLAENNIENDAKNDTKNAQKSVKKCIKNDAKIVKKNVKKIVKNDYIFSILFSIKNRSKLNQKNGKKGGRPSYENNRKATNNASLEKNTIAKNQKPNGYDFAYENNAKNQSEKERQNSKNNITNTCTDKCNQTVNKCVTVQNAVVDFSNEKNAKISTENSIENQTEQKNAIVEIPKTEHSNSFFKDKFSNSESLNSLASEKQSNDVVVENKIENENFPRESENIFSNQIANMSESQITLNFFVKLKPAFRFHKTNEIFEKTFQNGATLQDYRNAFQELSPEQQNSIKSINYLAAIVDKKQQATTNIVATNSNNETQNQRLIEAQIQLALTKRLNMIYFKINKRKEELKKFSVRYVYWNGEMMTKQAKIDFILQDLTPSEIELLKKENVNVMPETEIFDANNTPLIATNQNGTDITF